MAHPITTEVGYDCNIAGTGCQIAIFAECCMDSMLSARIVGHLLVRICDLKRHMLL